MTGFAAYLPFPTPDVDDSEFLAEETRAIQRIPGYSETSSFPINVGTKEFPFDGVLSDLMTSEVNVKRVRAERIAEIILGAPPELVSFDNFIVKESTKLKDLPGFILSIVKKNAKQFQWLSKIICSFLLRLPREQFIQEQCKSIIECMKNIQKDSPFIYAMELKILTLQIEDNTKNMSYISKLIIPLSRLLMRLYKSDFAEWTLPLICPKLAEVLFEGLKKVFEGEDWIVQEQLVCVSYSSLAFVTLAAVYPASLLPLPWRSIAKFFGRNPHSNRDFFPTHTFQIYHPSSVNCNQSSDNIIALMLAFSNFAQLKKENEKADISLYLLQTYSSLNPVGQAACARAFFTMSLYKRYKRYSDYFVDLIMHKNINATIVYINMMRNNYDHLTVKIEKKYNIACELIKGCVLEDRSIKTPIEAIACIMSPNIDTHCSIEEIIRTVDGLLEMRASEVVEYNSDSFMKVISSYIISMLKSGAALEDFRLGAGFAHLCASYVELLFKFKNSKTEKLIEENPLLANIYLLLLIEDHIMSLAPMYPSNKEIDNSYIASIYHERMRVAKAIFRIAPRFFLVGAEVCQKQKPSLILPLLVLLDDCLSINLSGKYDTFHHEWNNADFIVKISPLLARWIICFMRSESRITQDMLFELFSQLISTVLIKHAVFTKSFLTLFIDTYNLTKKDQKYLSSFTRIMHHYMKFMNTPMTKSAFLTCEDFNKTVLICAECIANDFSHDNVELASMACDALRGMCSANVSLISHLGDDLRFIVDTIDYELFKPIIVNIKSVLDNAGVHEVSFIVKILKLIMYLSKNKYWVNAFRKELLTFTFTKLRSISQLAECPVIINILFCIAVSISRLDTSYAKEFIGYEESKEIFEDTMYQAFDMRNEMISAFEYDEEKKLSIDIPLNELQEDVTFEKSAFFKNKVNAKNVTFPVNLMMMDLQPISENNFMSEIVVKGKKFQ